MTQTKLYEEAKKDAIITLICYCLFILIIPLIVGWIFNAIYLAKLIGLKRYLKDSNMLIWAAIASSVATFFLFIPAILNVILMVAGKANYLVEETTIINTADGNN